MSKEELIQKYSENENKIQELKSENFKFLKELAALYEHKVGEIIKYKKTTRKRAGTKWIEVVVEENFAVLTAIKSSVWTFPNSEPDLHYSLEFKSVKKDGGISKNNTYVNPNVDVVEWTGEIHDDYKNKDA